MIEANEMRPEFYKKSLLGLSVAIGLLFASAGAGHAADQEAAPAAQVYEITIPSGKVG